MTRKEIALQLTLKTLESQPQRISHIPPSDATNANDANAINQRNAQYVFEFYKTICSGLETMDES